MSDSLWPCGLQHARLPCPSPVPRACSNSRPLSWWCHPTISSSFVPFSSCLQSCSASGSFPISYLFTSGGQSIGVSASASVLSTENKTQIPPQPIPSIRKLSQASYPYSWEGRQNENYNHRKLIKLIIWTTALLTQWNYEPCHVRPPKTDRSLEKAHWRREWQTSSVFFP